MPEACSAAMAKIGISSIKNGIHSGFRSQFVSFDVLTTSVPMGSSGLSVLGVMRIWPPMACNITIIAARVGLRPILCSVSSVLGRIKPSTMKKAADEMSLGIVIGAEEGFLSDLGAWQVIFVPSITIGAPK